METHVRNAVVRAVHETTSSSLRGRPRKLSIAETLQKIFYVCKIGCQWRAIEGMDGVSCKTVYHWFRKWSKARVFEHAFYNLVHAYGNVTFNPLVCDTSFVKNVFGHDVVGRNPTDRGRNATKVSLLTDSESVSKLFLE
jgi:putative transposase